MNRTATIQKHIYLPLQLAELGKLKARRMGYSLTKYMEYLLAKDVEREAERVEILDRKTIQYIGKAIKDTEEDNFDKLLETEEDIDKYFS